MLASSQQHLQQQQRSNLKRSGRRRTMGKMSAVPSLLIVGFYAATIMLMSAGVVLVSAQTATVTPVEKYFLPIGEAALLESMEKVNYRAAAPLNSMNSITIAADGTYIWYDHWVSQQADSGFFGIFIYLLRDHSRNSPVCVLSCYVSYKHNRRTASRPPPSHRRSPRQKFGATTTPPTDVHRASTRARTPTTT